MAPPRKPKVGLQKPKGKPPEKPKIKPKGLNKQDVKYLNPFKTKKQSIVDAENSKNESDATWKQLTIDSENPKNIDDTDWKQVNPKHLTRSDTQRKDRTYYAQAGRNYSKENNIDH
jgi:hypothetical protein